MTYGTSYEGRDLYAIEIGSGSRYVSIDCGIHAREWISSATCRYFINEVLQANADPSYEVKSSLPYNADDLRGLLDFNW